ncbi:MAG: hypothetical protein K2X11_03930, partial [Acetobacteraceae bacterium]|nr:hypothetical protein [Acetobacteraceae bacterium]
TQRQARGGAGRGEEARAAYLAVAAALERGGLPEDRRLAAEVRRFAEGLAAPPRGPAGPAPPDEPALAPSAPRR